MDKSISPTISASTKSQTKRYSSILLRWVIAIALFDTFASSNLFAQERASDPESYKLKIEGQFWYATPIATVAGTGTQVPISFDKALGFSTYSTFTSDLDWHFKRKHHLLFIVSPNHNSHRHAQSDDHLQKSDFSDGLVRRRHIANVFFCPRI
jgi:hypothetical protein